MTDRDVPRDPEPRDLEPDGPEPHDPELTDEQAFALRRLLADARHDEPMPEAVVARLDAVLASLADEGTAAEESTPDAATVVTLERAVSRRRRWATGLVAAAAVVVGGVALPQLLPHGVDADTSDSTPANSGLERLEDKAAPEATSTAPGTPVMGDATADVVALTGDGLRAQLRRGLEGAQPFAGDPDSTLPCWEPAWETPRPEQLLPITYDARPGVAVARPAAGDRRRVDVFACGLPEPVRTVVIRR